MLKAGSSSCVPVGNVVCSSVVFCLGFRCPKAARLDSQHGQAYVHVQASAEARIAGVGSTRGTTPT